MKLSMLTALAYVAGAGGVVWAANQPVTAPSPVAAHAEVAAAPAHDAPDPKTARKLSLRYLPCPTTGDCRVILQWTRPAGYVSATDTAVVTWRQVTPSASLLDSARSRGSADTITITRPTAGAAKSGTVRLCYVRAGWNNGAAVCNSPLSWSVESIILPPDTATGLKVIGIYIKPDTAKITMAMWNEVGVYGIRNDTLFNKAGDPMLRNCPQAGAGKCPQQQFCAYTKMDDNKVYMTDNSATIPYCQTIFASFPNRAPTMNPAMLWVPDGQEAPTIAVHVNTLEDGSVAPDRVWIGDERLMQVSTGEWIKADFTPMAFAQ